MSEQSCITGALNCLSQVEWILLTWRVEPLRFPLNDELRRILIQEDALIDKSIKSLGAYPASNELMEAKQRIVCDVIYDQEELELLFSMYAGSSTKLNLDFQNRLRFLSQTKPALSRMLVQMFENLVWLRAYRWNRPEHALQVEAASAVRRFLESLYELAPADAGVQPPVDLLCTIHSELVRTDSIRNHLSSNAELAMVIAELRAIASRSIKSGDKLKHRTGITGTAAEDERNGAITVRQSDGTVTVWAAGDCEIVL